MLLKQKAHLPLSEEELRNIQIEIEDLTMSFDEKSIFRTVPNIIKILIRNDDKSAKDFLRSRELEKEDIELLSEFSQYMIEALIVHVLGMVFNSVEYDSLIHVASLVKQLESSVRI